MARKCPHYIGRYWGLGVAFSLTATLSANSFSIHAIRNTVPLFLGVEQHFLFAALFFISIAIICLKYFPRTNKSHIITAQGNMTQKAKRNVVYKICGWTIVVCVAFLGIYAISKPISTRFAFPVVFGLETIAIEAFGIAWITKGETLWPDGEHYIKKAYQQAKESLTQ